MRYLNDVSRYPCYWRISNLHFGPILPDVIKLHNVGMLNELQDCDLTLNRHGNPHLALDLFWKAIVPLAKGGQTAIMDKVRHTPVDNFNSGQLVRHAVATESYTSRRAFPQRLSQLPRSNMCFVCLFVPTTGRGLVRCVGCSYCFLRPPRWSHDRSAIGMRDGRRLGVGNWDATARLTRWVPVMRSMGIVAVWNSRLFVT